eukprot:TRINITY_DN18359_c0_g1_i1.p1 TRINITY_DN18359_c0_g1~~TRINITY_DN18359_c0_g1_i1.p1  ORF type:complete len:338 (-),score=14.50 TRINITY_DN18359_c0_g1_i1:170-1183(-)
MASSRRRVVLRLHRFCQHVFPDQSGKTNQADDSALASVLSSGALVLLSASAAATGLSARPTSASTSRHSWVPVQPDPRWKLATEVLLIRHGESENNVIMSQVRSEAEWLEKRRDDPNMTQEGIQQAEALAATYGPNLKERGCIIHCSPMLRTLQTAWPLAHAGSTDVKVNSDLYETGGVYTVAEGGARGGPGSCLSKKDIVTQFPGYDVSSLPESGPWYASGWESDAEGRKRCERVASWLRSQDLQQELNGRILVIVCHGHFIDMLLKELMRCPDDPATDRPGKNDFSHRNVLFAAQNTSTTRLTIRSQGELIIHSFADTAHLRVQDVSQHDRAVGS